MLLVGCLGIGSGVAAPCGLLCGCDWLSRSAPRPASIDLVPAVEGLVMPDDEIAIAIEPGGAAATWHPNQPAQFTGIDVSQPLTLRLKGKKSTYLVENGGQVKLAAGEVTRVAVIGLDSAPDEQAPASPDGGPAPAGRSSLDGKTAAPTPPGALGSADSVDFIGLIPSAEDRGWTWNPKGLRDPTFYVDTRTTAGKWTLTVREALVVLDRMEVAASPAAVAEAASKQWRQYGKHRDASDAKFDMVLVVAEPNVEMTALSAVLGALQTSKRAGKEGREVGAFRIRVVPPSAVVLPPLPAPPSALDPATAQGVGRARFRSGSLTVNGRLDPKRIEETVRGFESRVLLCYQHGLLRNPDLQGRVSVRFVIGHDGMASQVETPGSDLPEPKVAACVADSFVGAQFPEPEGETGIVTVVYPMLFMPK